MIYKPYHELTSEERKEVLKRLENGEEVNGIKWDKETGKLTIPYIPSIYPYIPSIYHDPLCQCKQCDDVYNRNQPERLSEKTSKDDAIV